MYRSAPPYGPMRLGEDFLFYWCSKSSIP